ncbi:MAG: DNA polymerase III subunit delta [Lentihominibacter sp.]
MAADYRKESEHAFVTIEKDLKEGRIPRLILLCGKEEYLIRWYTDTLVDRFVSDACRAIDLVVLEGESLTLENIIENTETISLMSERKVVLIQDFSPVYGKNIRGFGEADIKGLTDYFKDIPEGSLLLITASEPEDYRNKKSRIMTAVEKHGKIYDFQSLKDNMLRSFIEKRFRAAGKAYSSSVINLIMSESGYGNKAIDYTLYNLENDLKKIIAHCGSSSEVTAADVSDVLSTNPENDVFAMLDAIGRNRKDEAFRLLHNLIESGTPVFNLLHLITNQLELILTVKEMKDEGMTLNAIQKKLGIHQFRIRKAMAVTGQYSMDDLRKTLCAAYDVDENIKTGLLESTMALEFFIAQI